jgi:hypothetical protein
MDYAKLLAHGVGSWLQYEQACGHSGLFSEKYLAQPIGHILSGRSGNRALAEYAHPVLVKTARGPGRRPAIDFAICNPYPKVEIGVESKWIGKTQPDVESIVWDLMRLELLVHHEGARCFFVLGGKRGDLEGLFADKLFKRGSTDRKPRPFLRHDNNVIHSVSLGPVDRTRIGLFESTFENYPDLQFPSHVVSRRTAPFPERQIKNGYQVYVCEIRSVGNRTTFRGGAMKGYFPKPSRSSDDS